MSRALCAGLRLENPDAALQYELTHEKASTLGRLGRQLEAALAVLTRFDTEHPRGSAISEQDRTARAVLVAEASVALWYFIVQRESLGLRDSARAMRDYGVPEDVRARMGALPVGSRGQTSSPPDNT